MYDLLASKLQCWPNIAISMSIHFCRVSLKLNMYNNMCMQLGRLYISHYRLVITLYKEVPKIENGIHDT